jgi:hypothetical protein
MAKESNRDTFQTLHAETAKAIQRGAKFARSLMRWIVQRNPDASLQPLLEAVEKDLVILGARRMNLSGSAGRRQDLTRPATRQTP